MKYISLNWTLALKFSIGKKKENARLPNTYGARLYIYISHENNCNEIEVALSHHKLGYTFWQLFL